MTTRTRVTYLVEWHVRAYEPERSMGLLMRTDAASAAEVARQWLCAGWANVHIERREVPEPAADGPGDE